MAFDIFKSNQIKAENENLKQKITNSVIEKFDSHSGVMIYESKNDFRKVQGIYV